MDYKEKYEQALERAKYYRDRDNIQFLENIFPELAESEGEGIRKALLEMVHDTTGDSLWIDYNVHKEDAIAWLEKQGEQKSIDDLSPQEAMNIAVAKCFEQGEQKPADEEMIALLRTEYEKGRADAIAKMQKPWSEEDERLRTSCIKHIEEELERIRNDKYGHSEIISDLKESCRERINWLKSIRSKSQWKPSKEQMEALDFAVDCIVPGEFCFKRKELKGLLVQLMELREE